jgi:hypothetical protein
MDKNYSNDNYNLVYSDTIDNYQTTFCGTAFDFFDFTYTECMGVPGSSHKTGGVTHLGSPLPPHLGGVALASSSSSLQPPVN